jgi:hypothetical protein
MIYLFGWAVNYILLFVSQFTHRKRLAACLSILILGAVVVLRGRVGADTGIVYEAMAKLILTGIPVEPFFAGILIVMVLLFPTPLLAVTMGLGSLFVVLLLAYVRRADTHELFILQAFFIPAAFWISSVSGQRYGLAFGFLLLAMQSVRLKQFKWAAALSAMAILTHYSSVIFLVLWGVMILAANRKTYLRLIFLLTLVTIMLLAFAGKHLDTKFLLYFESDYSAPSILSGIANMFTTLLLLSGVALGSLERVAKFRIVIVSLLATACSIMLTQYSYGGLRLLWIGETVVPYAALTLYGNAASPIKVNFKTMILIAGIVGAIATYRNMLDEDRVLEFAGRSLPYTFFWQE